MQEEAQDTIRLTHRIGTSDIRPTAAVHLLLAVSHMGLKRRVVKKLQKSEMEDLAEAIKPKNQHYRLDLP